MRTDDLALGEMGVENANICQKCGKRMDTDSLYCIDCEIEMEIKQQESQIEM